MKLNFIKNQEYHNFIWKCKCILLNTCLIDIYWCVSSPSTADWYISMGICLNGCRTKTLFVDLWGCLRTRCGPISFNRFTPCILLLTFWPDVPLSECITICWGIPSLARRILDRVISSQWVLLRVEAGAGGTVGVRGMGLGAPRWVGLFVPRWMEACVVRERGLCGFRWGEGAGAERPGRGSGGVTKGRCSHDGRNDNGSAHTEMVDWARAVDSMMESRERETL